MGWWGIQPLLMHLQHNSYTLGLTGFPGRDLVSSIYSHLLFACQLKKETITLRISESGTWGELGEERGVRV